MGENVYKQAFWILTYLHQCSKPLSSFDPHLFNLPCEYLVLHYGIFRQAASFFQLFFRFDLFLRFLLHRTVVFLFLLLLLFLLLFLFFFSLG